MKRFLQILLYLSLGFLAVYLYYEGILIIPELAEPVWFIVSLIFVMAGYIMDVKAWQTIAGTEIKEIRFKHTFISTGKFIFSKYIPGKLWIIMGKAGYLKDKYNRSFLNLTSLSFFYQLIAIITGILTGIGTVFFIEKDWFFILILAAGLFIISIIFLYKEVIKILSRLLSFILRKAIVLPQVLPKTTLKVFLFSLSNWILWSVAFYFLLISAYPKESLSISTGFLFPVSAVVGILILIAPGGIGIREGFLTIGLTSFGMEAKEAASLAVLSRLWFLIGEFLFFGSTWFLQFEKQLVRKNAQ